MNKSNLRLATQLRHELHANPEESNNEKWTKERLISFLKEHTSFEVFDKGKWFYAKYKGKESAKNIAFRADFDAIPMEEGIDLPYGSKNKGFAHKCGHDGHSAALAALALEVEELKPEKDVYFLFQHAEEIGEGAKEAQVFIDEHKIDEIFAFHNMSGFPLHSINVIDGTNNFASMGVEMEFIGKPTHASQPEEGINPAYTISKLVLELEELTSKKNNKGLVLATVIQVALGERAFGIAASKGKLLLTIRAELEEELEQLKAKLVALAQKLSNDEGLELKVSYVDIFPATVNHKESVDKIRSAAKKLGYILNEREIGSRGSEDFGYYLKKTKGAMFYLGNGEDYPHVHTYEFDFLDSNIEYAVEIFLELIKG